MRTAAQKLVQLNRTSAPPLPESVAERLRALYAADVRALEGLLDRDLSSWTSG
jgi:hypothetical protein